MKIAFILFTDEGLECDDRIRKEMFSIRRLFENVEIKVFGFHRDNHAEIGTLSYGVPFELISIRNRGGKKGVVAELRKEMDFYSQIERKVNEYDLLWVCDEQPFFFPLFSRKPVIWDLHEIPHPIIGSRIKNILFHYMERRCKWLIHANQERLEYLEKNDVVKRRDKNLVLRNYPDNSWLKCAQRESESYMKFCRWLGQEEYIYVQGLTGDGRCAWETLSAIMETKRLKAVIIGPVPQRIMERVKSQYPDANQYLYYTGRVMQLDTAAFIAHCKFSIVFYKIDTPNNRYCEPNRMFQALGMGKPVIVGKNEPMASVVTRYGNGIAIDSDGRDVEDNIKAINRMLKNYEEIRSRAEMNKSEFAWNSQYHIFEKIFQNFL